MRGQMEDNPEIKVTNLFTTILLEDITGWYVEIVKKYFLWRHTLHNIELRISDKYLSSFVVHELTILMEQVKP